MQIFGRKWTYYTFRLEIYNTNTKKKQKKNNDKNRNNKIIFFSTKIERKYKHEVNETKINNINQR